MTMDDAARRAANKQVFAEVQATISAGEFDKLGQFMAEDLHFELPYGPAFMPKEFDAETKAKAVRLVRDHREDYAWRV